MSKNKTAKNLFLNIILLLGCILCMLLFSEILTRQFFRQNIRPTFVVSDERVKNRLRENAVFYHRGKTDEFNVKIKTNSYGWRSNELDDTEKILIVGDSYTFGFGVAQDKIYPAQLERILKNKGYNYHVTNMGVEGRSPDQYWADYHYFKDLINPSIIVVGFFEGNDFINGSDLISFDEGDHARFSLHQISGFYSLLRRIFQGSAYDILSQHSHLAVVLKNRLFTLLHGSFIEEAYLDPAQTNGEIERRFEQKTAFTFKLLKGLRDEARHDGVHVVVLIIPMFKPILASAYTDRLVTLLKNEEILVVDLREQLHNKPPVVYYHTIDDNHWNENGHRLAAEELSKLLIYHNSDLTTTAVYKSPKMKEYHP